MRHLLCIGSLLLLSGCFSDQQQATATCTYETRKQYPDMSQAGPFDKYGAYLMDCMGAAGYVFSFASPDCPALGWPAANAYCYRPRGRVASWMLEVEMKIKAFVG